MSKKKQKNSGKQIKKWIRKVIYILAIIEVITTKLDQIIQIILTWFN